MPNKPPLQLSFALLTTGLLLAGSGKKDEPQTTPAGAPAPSGAPAKPEPLKIAFAYIGPVGDGGWTYAHDRGREALQKELGDKVVTSFVENVPEAADAERVFRDMVGQGNKLIFGKVVLAQDAVADDRFLGGIDFYVKGVEGKVPLGK